MSKRFQIKSTRPPEVKESGKIVFGSGEQVPFRQSLVLHVSRRINDKEFELLTGLEERHIDFNPFIADEEEKKALKKQQKEDLAVLQKYYGSKEILKPTNSYFWIDDGRGSFAITNETLSSFFDTKNPEHMLLYWKIIGGGYADAIGSSYDAATQFALPFYLTELEEEAERKSEDIGFKGKAFAALEEINERKSAEDLLWLSWMLLDANKGYTMKTPKATLYAAHFEFIEGKLVKKSKKLCAKQFLDAYNLLKTDKTSAIAIAVVKAAEYFSLIFTNKEGQLETRSDRKVLGSTIEDAIETLLKPSNIESLESLREEVEEKLK